MNLAEAKAHLSAIVEQAAGGEPVRILRRGRPVAQVTAIETQRKPIDPAQLRAITSRMPSLADDAETLVRTMRDAERY